MTDGCAGAIDVWAQGWRVWWQSDFGWAIDGCLRSYEPLQAQFGPIFRGMAWRNTWFTCKPSGVFVIPFHNTCEWFQATI